MGERGGEVIAMGRNLRRVSALGGWENFRREGVLEIGGRGWDGMAGERGWNVVL